VTLVNQERVAGRTIEVEVCSVEEKRNEALFCMLMIEGNDHRDMRLRMRKQYNAGCQPETN
jgi:hypothetical protein